MYIWLMRFGSIVWTGSYPSLTSNRANDEGDIISLLSSLEFWTVLYPFESPPFFQEEDESGTPTRALGYNQVGVRRAGWMTAQQVAINVTSLWQRYVKIDSNIRIATDPTILKALSIAALRSAWIEPDSGVRTSMFEGLLLVLTSKFWIIREAERRANSYYRSYWGVGLCHLRW